MSRQQQQQPQGVVLTGYHSNAELLPKSGLCAPSGPPAQDPGSTEPRWDISRGCNITLYNEGTCG